MSEEGDEADRTADGERDTAPGWSWFVRLRNSLGRSANGLTDGIANVVRRRRLDDEALEELEETLIAGDLGVAVARELCQSLARARFGRTVTDEEVRTHLAGDIANILQPVALPLAITAGPTPHVVLVMGVNGSGKTTTLSKLARQWRDAGHSVLLVAGDTFRAAAIEQLQVWGERISVPVIAGKPGADASGLAYDAVERARRENIDILAIDTAGRLHNKADLMAELAKIVRVLKKLDPDAPHTTLLVLDATVGQNAHQQVQLFNETAAISGLVVTKLDGTAKGGVVVGLARAFGLPIHAIGVGEAADDLRPFEAQAFARSLLGLDT